MRSIGLMGEKGGCARSTTTINLAAGLAKSGRSVLVIDADGQANTTLVMLLGHPADGPTLADVLLGKAEAADAVRGTGIRRVDLIPADPSLADVNVLLAAEVGRERRLRLALDGTVDEYDYVLVDTGPTRTIVNANVMNAVQEVLAPVEPGLFSLAGLGMVQQAIAEVSRFLDNRALKLGGVLLTRCRNDNVSRDAERQLRETFGELVYRVTIPTSVKVDEATSRFLPVVDYAPRSPAAVAYMNLVQELIDGERAQDGARGAAGGAAQANDAA